jgi:crotonobetainyl-CoA:carnitine CoA-transferase CaiB-like acyl-CoA transferase
MSGILEGIRVLDITMWIVGAVASAHLGDLGAEVIKIEPLTGDGARGMLSTRSIPMGEWNHYFEQNNRNKKSMAIDLAQEKGTEILHRLVERADILVTNFTLGALRRLKMDYETVSGINPQIIYASGLGYGRYGPMGEMPAYDFQAWARSGLMLKGEPGQPPIYAGFGTGDIITSLFLAFGVLTALCHRDRTGAGQEVDASILGSTMQIGARVLQPYLATADDYFTHQRSRKDALNPLCNVYPTKDKWIFLCMHDSDRFWPDLCRALALGELEHDPRFCSADARRKNASALVETLDSILSTRSAAEWLEKCNRFGLLVSPINNFADLASDPQLQENPYFVNVEHPRFGNVGFRGFPVEFSKTPCSIRNLVVELGQHTEEILTEELGYTWEQVTQLKDARVIL